MTRNDDKTNQGRGTSTDRDWQLLFARLRSSIDWALEIATDLADDYKEELTAIERVRGYASAWSEGRHVDIDVTDVLTTLAILFAAIEIDLGADSLPLLPIAPTSVPGARQAPSRSELPTVFIRRSPLRRNPGGAFNQLAA